MSTNNPNTDNEIYGDGMGRSGNGTEQTDIAQKSLQFLKLGVAKLDGLLVKHIGDQRRNHVTRPAACRDIPSIRFQKRPEIILRLAANIQGHRCLAQPWQAAFRK